MKLNDQLSTIEVAAGTAALLDHLDGDEVVMAPWLSRLAIDKAGKFGLALQRPTWGTAGSPLYEAGRSSQPTERDWLATEWAVLPFGEALAILTDPARNAEISRRKRVLVDQAEAGRLAAAERVQEDARQRRESEARERERDEKWRGKTWDRMPGWARGLAWLSVVYDRHGLADLATDVRAIFAQSMNDGRATQLAKRAQGGDVEPLVFAGPDGPPSSRWWP